MYVQTHPLHFLLFHHQFHHQQDVFNPVKSASQTNLDKTSTSLAVRVAKMLAMFHMNFSIR